MIRMSLEGSFRSVRLEGELSNFKPSSTGHLYFTLKDAGAAISGVMFKNRLRYLSFEPADGMLLRVKGSVSVYAQRGSYQIICEEMELAGAGDILAMLEKRKQLLAAEGLFDAERKKPIPRFPACIGIISSPTGAAVHDILTILQRRAPGIRIILLPTLVQGAEAGPMIVRRIEQANQWNLADTLILGRGGGSLEDLLPFSQEEVVRAVANSRIPVISAVGHEIDWALSDYAADLRAPTPSAAAEMASAARTEAALDIQAITLELHGLMQRKLERARLLLKPFNPMDLEYRLRSILQPHLVRFDDAKEELLESLGKKVRDFRQRVIIAKTTLDAASPLAILERGYSMVTHGRSGKILYRSGDAAIGDPIHIRFREGALTARVELIDEGAHER